MLRRGLELGQYPQAIGREEAWLAERLRVHQDPKAPWMQELPGNRWLRIAERRTREGGIAGVRTDVTELVRRGQALQQLNGQLDGANAELRRLSETDALTGLPNRRVFDRHLDEEVARARRHDLPLALLAIDIDHFKRYNDCHGHPAGDAALQSVAAVLARQARRPSDLAARTGGEEFVLLLPHTNAEQALAQAERLIRAVDEAALPHGDSPIAGHLTLSVGAALLRPGWNAEGLKAAADAALYAAKQAGRHRARPWSEAMVASTRVDMSPG
jgi:diguanylate cyclase (GGDEF)-like protein